MIGRTIAHYTVTDTLGVGGMGEVYRARDSKLHREVAIKVLPAALAHDPDHLARFAREAQVLAGLNHPNIAAVYGLEDADGVKALVMELVPGETLADRIRRGPLPVEEAARISHQIAEALEEAHEHGIIHRDLKPANVKITPEGRVKVLDFGLAKALESQGGNTGLTHSPTISLAATQAGVILGTAGYMSPEQAAAQQADRRADIWSFGIVLLEMLTGRQAFTGETVSHVLAAVLHGSPDLEALPKDTPPRIRELLERCLSKNVKSRLQHIGDARVLLEEYVADPQSFVARAPEVVTVPGRSARLAWSVAAAAAAVAVAALALALWPRPAPPPAVARVRGEVSSGEQLFLGSGASAVLSPDGRKLAMVVGNGSSRSLNVRDLDELTSTALPGTEVAYNPFFSPDGQWIGFVTPGDLKKVSATGGTPLSLAPVSRSRGASWGEGDVIVVAPDPNSGLSRLPATGGKLEPLTTLDEEGGEFSHRWPQVLPGGRAVLFTVLSNADSSEAGTLEIADLETGEREVVHRGGVYGRYLEGGYLCYITEGTLFAAPFDLERRKFTRTPAPVVQGIATAGGAQFDVASDGTLVYLEGQSGTPRYELVEVDRRGAASLVTSERSTFVEPRFSPDGRRLSVEVLTGSGSDCWVFDLDRGTATRLTFNEGLDSVPVWSPDGRSIVFSSDKNGAPNLYRKLADGSGDEERLTESNDSQYPSSWSPDGRYLLVSQVASRTGNDILMLELEADRGPEPYLVTEFSEAEGAFSPDGRWVAYQSEETGRSEVYIRPFPPRGGKWQISVEGGTHPRWADNGKELIFRNANTVMSVAIDISGEAPRAGSPQKLFEGPFLQASIGGNVYADYDVSGDGQRFAMLRGESREVVPDHLVFVFHWLDELRATFGER